MYSGVRTSNYLIWISTVEPTIYKFYTAAMVVWYD